MEIHRQSREAAGARTISETLKAQGILVGRFKAARLMEEASIKSKQPNRVWSGSQ